MTNVRPIYLVFLILIAIIPSGCIDSSISGIPNGNEKNHITEVKVPNVPDENVTVVPNLELNNKKDAEIKAKQAHLILSSFESFDDNVPAGLISYTYPDKYQDIPVGSVIRAQISKGPKNKSISGTIEVDEKERIIIQTPYYIYTIDADGSSETRVGMGKAPRWSIDGKKIFYLTCQVENCAGPLLPTGEQVMERPYGMPKNIGYGGPATVQFGGVLIFSNLTIHSVNPEGNNEIDLSENPIFESGELFVWSPDGNKIAGGYNGMNGLLELVIGDFDGNNKIKLPGNQTIEDIKWSPDSNKIAFVTKPENILKGSILYIINSDGTNRIELDDGHNIPRIKMDWSKDNRHIVYVSQQNNDVIYKYGTGSVSNTILNIIDIETRYSKVLTYLSYPEGIYQNLYLSSAR